MRSNSFPGLPALDDQLVIGGADRDGVAELRDHELALAVGDRRACAGAGCGDRRSSPALAPAASMNVGSRSRCSTSALSAPPAGASPARRRLEHHRHVDQLVVEAGAVGHAAVLEELLAVVGGDDDQACRPTVRARAADRTGAPISPSSASSSSSYCPRMASTSSAVSVTAPERMSSRRRRQSAHNGRPW